MSHTLHHKIQRVTLYACYGFLNAHATKLQRRVEKMKPQTKPVASQSHKRGKLSLMHYKQTTHGPIIHQHHAHTT